MTDLFLTLVHHLAKADELPALYADRLLAAAAIYGESADWRTAATTKLLRDAIAGELLADTAYCLAHRLLTAEVAA